MYIQANLYSAKKRENESEALTLGYTCTQTIELNHIVCDVSNVR